MSSRTKPIPTKKAILELEQSKATEATVVQIISNHPDHVKKGLIQNLSKDLHALSKNNDVVVVFVGTK